MMDIHTTKLNNKYILRTNSYLILCAWFFSFVLKIERIICWALKPFLKFTGFLKQKRKGYTVQRDIMFLFN